MRDLIGYGWKYPKVEWPEGARVVVSLVLNYEEGSELCIGDGDAEGERVGEFVYPTMDSRTRDLGIESTFEYGARVARAHSLPSPAPASPSASSAASSGVSGWASSTGRSSSSRRNIRAWFGPIGPPGVPRSP